MGDIFDQVAAKKPATGDIFDQVAGAPAMAPTPSLVGAPGLAPPAGAPPKSLDSGEGPIAAGLTSMETQLSKMPGGLLSTAKTLLPGTDEYNSLHAMPMTQRITTLAKGLNPVVRENASLTPEAQSSLPKGSPNPVDWGATAANILPAFIDPAGGGITESPAVSGIQGLKNAASKPPAPTLVEGVYSKPGSQIAASLRGSTRFDVPAVASDAHAAISEGLADRGLSASDFKGRNGPAALQAGIDNAIDIHEARAKQVIDPIRDQEVDTATLNANPELKARFSADQIKKGLTYGDLDAERIQLNKDLRRANFYSKDPSAQYAFADPLADAHAAADQARSLVYGKAGEVTGTDLRPLKQTESGLIKLGDLAETTKNGLSLGAAQNETASPVANFINTVKKVAAVKKNPASSLASLASSPETLDLDGFNSNMRKAFANVKSAPGSVLKNGRLLEPGPGVLTPPRGQTPPEANRQLPLSLEPNKPGYELTPPPGKTPPDIQPRQGGLPLTSSYAPMGEHAGLVSNIPGEAVPGQNLTLDPQNGINTPLQNLLDFSNEAHPVDAAKPLPRSLGAAASTTDVPEILRKGAGIERRSSVRSAPMSIAEIEEAMKKRQPITTPFDQTEGAMDTIKADKNMPKHPRDIARLGADGEVSWPDSYKNPPKGGGGNYNATQLDELKRKMGLNGSGESSASAEAMSRSASEKSAGTKRVVVDTRSGSERPLLGVDAVDYRPKDYESVEFRGGKRDGEIIDQGSNARPYRRK